MPPTPAAWRQQKGNWVLRHLPAGGDRAAEAASPAGPAAGRLVCSGVD